jgi:hypothetical protein
MTHIKIYVVKTELKNLSNLEVIQTELLNEFGGLTIIKNCVGLWVDSSTVKTLGYKAICKDKTDIWEIYTNRTLKSSLESVQPIALKLKVLCKQISQLFVINNKAYFL